MSQSISNGTIRLQGYKHQIQKIYFSNITFSDQRVLDQEAEHQSPFDTAWLAKIMDMSPSIGYALDDLFVDATGIQFEVLEMHLYRHLGNDATCERATSNVFVPT